METEGLSDEVIWERHREMVMASIRERMDKAAKRRAKWARRVARGGKSRGQQKRADYKARMEKR